MSACDVSACTLLDEDCICLKGFNISFSWDYPDNWCLKDVKETVFHMLDASDQAKPDTATLISLVQSSGAGVVLTQPNPERDVIPCELHLKAHPDSIQFCIIKILVISEAKHIELYINDMYDKTSKGSILSMKKGKKAAIYENQLDLSAHVQGTQKVTLKFLSLADKGSLRLQAVVLTIIECSTTPPKKSLPITTDVHSVREMIKSMNLTVTDNAEKLLKDIESQQKQNQNLLFQNLLQTGNINPQQFYQNIVSQNATPQNIISSQIGMPQVNNFTLQPPVVMPSLSNGEQHFQLATDSKCCVHSLPQQQISYSIPSPCKVVSKSCPGSRIGSPGPRCMHTQNHMHVLPPDGQIMNGCSCIASHRCCIENTCFGVPNPPNESVLANAILNERPSKEVSKNRIAQIEHENYHEAQLELQNNFHKSENSNLSEGSVRLRHADNVSKKCLADRKRRAKSLCLMPTESEIDFSKLLTEIIKDETDVVADEQDIPESNSTRWESYLRSRVRASQRNSDVLDDSNINYGAETMHNGYLEDYEDVPKTAIGLDESEQYTTNDIRRCKECGSSGSHEVFDNISKNLILMEEKLTSRIDTKIEELRNHLDKRLDNLFEIINVPQPYEYDEALCSNTEV